MRVEKHEEPAILPSSATAIIKREGTNEDQLSTLENLMTFYA